MQLSSSFKPLLQSGVWVAPQFEHSALTPPGAEFPKVFPVPRNKAGFKLVAVALGPDERVMAAVWVRRVKVGRPVGVLERVP